MVSYVLSRGCRFLDFEVYYDNTGTYPCVGYSSDPMAVSPTISNTNSVLLVDLLKSTLSSAFISNYGSNYFTSNANDPLFINLRMKTGSQSPSNLYSSIQNVLITLYNSGFSQYFFVGSNGDNYINSNNHL
jgi:hypothetical protein